MESSSGSFGPHDVSDMERIAYIQEVLGELRSISRSVENGDVLTYFLEMAMMEAADTAREIARRM